MNFMKQNFENTNKKGIDLRDLGIDAYAYDYSVILYLLDNLKDNNQIYTRWRCFLLQEWPIDTYL